jgi:flagellar motor switch protein FliM
MRDLSSLRPGGVLLTGLEPNSEAEVLVAGKPRFRAVAGRVGRKLAVRITSVAESDRAGANGDN